MGNLRNNIKYRKVRGIYVRKRTNLFISVFDQIDARRVTRINRRVPIGGRHANVGVRIPVNICNSFNLRDNLHLLVWRTARVTINVL